MKLLCFLCKELLTEETMGLEIPNDPIFARIKFGGIQYGQTHFILGSGLIKESSPESPVF